MDSEFVKWLIVRVADVILAPLTLPSSLVLKLVRRLGIAKVMPVSKKIFHTVGVFPIRDHYYEPLFNTNSLEKSLREDRRLPGIDLNVSRQLEVLGRFDFGDELVRFPLHKQAGVRFYYHNKFFESGDAEYLYSMIRFYKPSMLVEIGSGFSTLIAREAIKKNSEVDPDYGCEHVCVEPYENEWLNGLGVEVIRKPVQHVDESLFRKLGENDILFIDSSHVIRPQGDVLFEYLEVLPSLKPGVLVHIHDIFIPKDYPDEWVRGAIRFWNEQYLLEAFLSFNERFEVIGALNFLAHNHPSELVDKFPVYKEEAPFKMAASYREPASFWIVKVPK